MCFRVEHLLIHPFIISYSVSHLRLLRMMFSHQYKVAMAKTVMNVSPEAILAVSILLEVAPLPVIQASQPKSSQTSLNSFSNLFPQEYNTPLLFSIPVTRCRRLPAPAGRWCPPLPICSHALFVIPPWCFVAWYKKLQSFFPHHTCTEAARMH